MSRLGMFILTGFLGFLCVSASGFAGTKDFDKKMKPVLRKYLVIQKGLAADNLNRVTKAANAIVRKSSKLDAATVTGKHVSHYEHVPMKIRKAAKEIAAAKDIKSAREGFKKLSRPMAMWAGMSKPNGVDVVYCPMAKASWLQKSGDVRNPYFGKKMLSCGEVVE